MSNWPTEAQKNLKGFQVSKTMHFWTKIHSTMWLPASIKTHTHTHTFCVYLMLFISTHTFLSKKKSQEPTAIIVSVLLGGWPSKVTLDIKLWLVMLDLCPDEKLVQCWFILSTAYGKCSEFKSILSYPASFLGDKEKWLSNVFAISHVIKDARK